MHISIFPDSESLGQAAAEAGAIALRNELEEWGHARLILATGTSQYSVLKNLVIQPDIAWHRVTLFHLDEYLGLPPMQPASFRKFLWDRFVTQLPVPLAAAHWINGDANPHAERKRLNALIREEPIDVAFIGIGENGHLAFNDPPADFVTQQPFIVVNLDEACRKQQLGEGWFPTLEDVPKQAISMSINQIMKSRAIICSVPDQRKAVAVKNALTGPVTPQVPASILQQHDNTKLFLDQFSATLLPKR